ncbi:MAG: ChrR family anti-sigma-E factor [Granulosicoccus sp.]
MSVSHHLTSETIQDYASGSLSPSMETLVACHLTVCSHCRRRAELADQVGGSLFEQGESEHVTLSAAELLRKAASFPEHSVPSVASAASTGNSEYEPKNGVPRPLARLLPDRLEELDWSRIAPGIKQFNLSDQHRSQGAFKLLHLNPGVVLSEHSHNDRELTYIVRGSYQDSIGRFKAGDIADLDDDILHQPVVDTDEPCIALIATQSPVRYSGILGKIMQPFVGI